MKNSELDVHKSHVDLVINEEPQVVRGEYTDEKIKTSERWFPHSEQFLGITTALLYGISSIVIMVVNKYILTTMRFPSAQVLGIGQMLTTVVILHFAKQFKYISFPDLTAAIPFQIFPLPIFYIGNLICGLSGTKKLNLPMFVVLRRFTILMTLIGEFTILGKNQKLSVVAAVFGMIFGAIVAAMDDLTFDAIGYAYVLSNDFLTAANGICSKKKLEAKELGKYGLLFYNCFFMIVPASILAVYAEDIDKVVNYEHWNDIHFQVAMFLSCIMGFFLMYATLLCTAYNSPLTTTIMGSLKNILITYFGILFGSDYVFTPTNFSGLTISAISSIGYAYLIFFRRQSMT